MARLPQPGGDSNTWDTVLNEYLSQSLSAKRQDKIGEAARELLSQIDNLQQGEK